VKFQSDTSKFNYGTEARFDVDIDDWSLCDTIQWISINRDIGQRTRDSASSSSTTESLNNGGT